MKTRDKLSTSPMLDMWERQDRREVRLDRALAVLVFSTAVGFAALMPIVWWLEVLP